MSEQINKSKRLAKNTVLLYVRMLLTMFIGLYTSRVVLHALGVEDYGIYNVVGGLVTMFTVLSGSLSAAISRFITFELGKGNKDRLKRVFSTSINIQFILIAFIVVLMETIGLWFLNYKMVISAERLTAANWVFQFSVLTFAMNLWSVPYNAAIIAHEKMSAFAYIGILDSLCRLGVAFMITYSNFDHLIYYALLLMIVGIIIRLIYGFYCKRNFDETIYHFVLDKSLLNDMFSFAGWNFIGAAAGVCRTTGVNILINLFYGANVNAARGLSVQLNNAISGFANNFMTALNPQITKAYAEEDFHYMNMLLFKGTKLAYFLLMLISMPVLIETDLLLSIWLKQVPDYAIVFVQYILIFAMCESLSGPLITAMLATGNIKRYQIIVGGTNLLNLPISYFLLKIFRFENFPQITMVVAIVLSIVCLFERLILMRKMIKLDSFGFIHNVISPVFFVTILVLVLSMISHNLIVTNTLTSIINLVIVLFFSCILIYTVGISKNERVFLKEKIRHYIKVYKNEK